jgi:hypothetical protein
MKFDATLAFASASQRLHSTKAEEDIGRAKRGTEIKTYAGRSLC